MRQLQIVFILILISIQNVYSQDKVIKGDTAFWFKRDQVLDRKLELTDFKCLQADFSFRFKNQGQVVEIIKTNNQIYGELTNYTFHNIKKRNDTIYQKIQIDSIKAQEIYEIIQKSGILDLQSENKAYRWQEDSIGIVYIIEYSDKKEYRYEKYWNPSIMYSNSESLVVVDFIKAISNSLQLPAKYKEFEKSLSPIGCYDSGGLTKTCYISNILEFGYFGSTRLPLGFKSVIQSSYIGDIFTRFELGFQYKFDRNDNYDLAFNAVKRQIFLNSSKGHDFLSYNYKKRKLNFVDTNTVFQNHQLIYGFGGKNKITYNAGIDYMIADKEMIGGIFGISKWFNNYIQIDLTSSIFKDEIDYKMGISKLIFLGGRIVIRYLSVGLDFENFKDSNDLSLYITLWL